LNKKETNEKKIPFFPVFLFIGMGIGFLLIEVAGGLAFVSAMFIGMGLGFLFDSIVTVKKKKITVELPVKASGIVAMLIGMIFIAGGTLALIQPQLIMNLSTYFIGLGFIVVGIYIMLQGYSLIHVTRK